MYLASATLFTERKKDRLSFPSTDANTSFALEREREREKERVRFLRVKNGAHRTIPPKRKSASSKCSRDDAKRRKRRRDNESEQRDSNEQLSPRRFARARNLRFNNEKNNSRFKDAEECIINASRRKRGRRIGRRRRRLESDDLRGGRRRR